MEDYLKKYGMHSVIISILLIILSLFLMFAPIGFLTTIIILLGCVLAINGLIHAISYFNSPKELRTFSFELVYGIIGMIAGLIFVLNPEWLISFLPIIVGIWIIIESIIKFQLSLNLRGTNNSHWAVMLVLSLITAILGIYIIFHPLASAAVLITLCGTILLVSEVFSMIECIYIMMKLK